LYESLAGEAALESMEQWLTLRVVVDRLGHVAVLGEVRDHPGSGNTLTFFVDGLDQTHLPPILAALRDVEVAFPVVGAPKPWSGELTGSAGTRRDAARRSPYSPKMIRRRVRGVRSVMA
jgi:hypothetical protein